MSSKSVFQDQKTTHLERLNQFKKFLRTLLPRLDDVYASLRLFALIIIGGVLLFPVFSRLPILGWDWYFFFNANHPTDNIYSSASPFFPYTKYFIMCLTWLNWRDSLALLGGFTFTAIALGTWQNGGRFGSILLALLTPLPFILLWAGHPDGLALIGLLTGFIPLALIKPQITFWAFLRDRINFFWLVFFLMIILLIWPHWLDTAFGNRWDHSAAFGWQALGWPLLIFGLVLMLGAGNDPWRLMAAGCFVTPDLMPYHLVVLLPAIGRVKGRAKWIIWFTTWILLLGVGLGGNYRFLNLLFPLSIYLSLQTMDIYRQNVLSHVRFLQMVWFQFNKVISRYLLKGS